jgi:hypothetical protein
MRRPSALRVWADEAEAGDSMIYHVGSHAYGEICREAMDMYEAGLISLVRQRQDKTSVFNYIAQRTKMQRKIT